MIRRTIHFVMLQFALVVLWVGWNADGPTPFRDAELVRKFGDIPDDLSAQ
jgi:hypothetical protein